MGLTMTAMCELPYNVCGGPTEDNDSINTTDARRQTLHEKTEKEKEEKQLQTLLILIEKSNDKQSLYKRCKDNNFKLLYKGSKDGYNVDALRTKCNDIPEIFIIITSTAKNIFGAYTSKGFNSDKINSYISDSHAFLFSLNDGLDGKIYDLTLKSENKTYALKNSYERLVQIGGTPGCDPDICIIEKCDKERGSFLSKNIYSANAGQLNGGSRYFRCNELLIYTVSPDCVPLTSADDESYEAVLKSGGPDVEIVDDDDISYASSGDFEDYDKEYGNDTEQKVHIYIVDKEKENEFKEPVYVQDIDEEDEHYAGSAMGNDWDDVLQRSRHDLSVDITTCLGRLEIERSDCKVLFYVQDKVNGDKLERIDDDMLSGLTGDEDTEEYADEVKHERIVQFQLKPAIVSVSEDAKIKDIDLLRKKSESMYERRKQMGALRMKYSSRRVVLHGKNKKKTPKCSECDTYFHIQSDPINAYGGTGIVCDICHKNRKDNPEMVTECYYYKCESCRATDICSSCYREEKRKLNEEYCRQEK